MRQVYYSGRRQEEHGIFAELQNFSLLISSACASERVTERASTTKLPNGVTLNQTYLAYHIHPEDVTLSYSLTERVEDDRRTNCEVDIELFGRRKGIDAVAEKIDGKIATLPDCFNPRHKLATDANCVPSRVGSLDNDPD